MASIFDILLYNVVAFLAVLTLIVAVHEAGHWSRAGAGCRSTPFRLASDRSCSAGLAATAHASRFPAAAGWLRAHGGWVDHWPAEADAAADEGFPNRPIWQRALIICWAAGQLHFAFLLLLGMGLALDRAVRLAKIGAFTGIQQQRRPIAAGDEILAVDGRVETSVTSHVSWRCTQAVPLR